MCFLFLSLSLGAQYALLFLPGKPSAGLSIVSREGASAGMISAVIFYIVGGVKTNQLLKPVVLY